MTIARITPRLWAAALIAGAIADLDTQSTRGRGQYRGEQQIQINTLGAVGELLVHGLLRAGVLDYPAAAADLEAVTAQWGNGSRGADLPISKLDVKGIPLDPGKRFWAINARVADRASRTGCIVGYLGVGVPLFGSLGFVTDPVPSSDLHAPRSGWRCFALGYQPSYNLNRNDHLHRYGISGRDQGRVETAGTWTPDQVLAELETAAEALVRTYDLMDECRVGMVVEKFMRHANGEAWADAESLALT